MSAPASPAGPTLAEAAELAGRLASQAARAAATPAHERSKVLLRVSEAIEKDREGFAREIVAEVKKPLKEARREVDRAVFTFRWASEEAKRAGGEYLPLDLDANSEGRFALVRRFPRGPCLFITPFNFPLNLVAHKVAPAIAVGAPFLLKPAPQAPKTAARLARVLEEAGWPKEFFAVVDCSNEVAEAFVRDERFEVLSFTGSASVGWRLKGLSPKKHVVLELGGNAGALVGPDADIPWAAARCAWGAYYYSGQVCISVQRLFVHREVYDDFKDLYLRNVAELKVGDPADEATDVGPLIDSRSADRVQAWIDEAVKGGGKPLAGGPRRGDLLPPTLIEDAPEGCRLSCEEAFGPVATIEPVATMEAGFQKLAASTYGLQAGVFTKDLTMAVDAWKRLRVGGVIVNDIPSYRSDAMPYGGSKESGVGREGVRWAMEEFTEPRALVVNP